MKFKNKISKGAISIAITAALTGNIATAADFYLGENDDIELRVNTKLSIGASWRIEEADKANIFVGNGGTAYGSGADDGNINYAKGDSISQIFKGLTEFQISKDNFGAVVKVKYWYDTLLKNKTVPHGHGPNNYLPNTKVNDENFEDFTKFSGIELLDAYVWGQFELGEVPVDLRLGRQVISWGESTFIQGGLNSINPFDVSAFRRPGAELKEGLLPVGMVYANLGLTESLSLEAFYQYEWVKTQIDGCGTFFSENDFAATGCDGVTLNTGGLDDKTSWAAGLVAPRFADAEPEDGGQYGVAMRYVSAMLNDTEFGLYYYNIHSRLPLLNGNRSAVPVIYDAIGLPGDSPIFVPSSMDPTGGALAAGNPGYFVGFPEDLKYYGVSFATNIGGMALSGEATYKPDTPVQISGPELLNAALSENPLFDFTSRVTASAPGEAIQGWDPYDVTQVQVTAVKFIDQFMGASRITFIGEVGATFTKDIEDADLRYSRDAHFGLGDAYVETLQAMIPPLAGTSCETTYAATGLNGDCKNDGFTTDSAWGYRARVVFDYSNVFAGISLKPTISWSHDVSGFSPSPSGPFSEGKKILGLNLNALYKSVYSIDLSYTAHSGGSYNLASDKDFVSASFSVSF